MHYRHRIRFLSDHLARMAASAAHFAIPFDSSAANTCIKEVIARDIKGDGAHKVRITLNSDGVFAGTASRVIRIPRRHRKLCISPLLVDQANPYFHHKTTRRALYESEFSRAGAAGYDEVLFFNTRGMLAEGSRHNVFVRIAGTIFTPPPASGVLQGVYRKQILSRCPQIKVRPIRRAELMQASDLYLTNAVQGLRRYVCRGKFEVLSFPKPEST